MAVATSTKRAATPARTTKKAPSAKTTQQKTDKTSNETLAIETEVARDLRLLRAILTAPAKSATTTIETRRLKTPTALTAANAKRNAKPVVTKSKTGKDEHVRDEAPVDALPPPLEQKKLAMNSFNKSLKVLSSAAKSRQTSAPGKSNEEAAIESTNLTGKELNDLCEQADLACAGLDVLRLHDEEDTKLDSTLQREKGAVLLLEKLITLQLKEQSHKEATRIHDQCRKRQRAMSKGGPPKKTQSVTSLHDLLLHDGTCEEKKEYDMVCSLQSQVLRLCMLEGPAVVTEELVRAISVDSKGSPARLILEGIDLGYAEISRAGENLRTIAQALTKLYSLAVKNASSSPSSKLHAFSLLIEAQIIRLNSWKVLIRQPDLEQELWAPVERAARHLWHKSSQQDKAKYDATKKLLQKVKASSEQVELDTTLPPALSDFLSHLAEANGDHEYAAELLEVLCNRASTSKQLFYHSRHTVALLGDGISVSAALASAKTTLASFAQIDHADLAVTADDLVTMVRLRKACAAQLATAHTLSENDIVSELVRLCLELVVAIQYFCASQMHETCQQGVKLRQSLQVAALKTIEAITDAEKYVISASQAVLNDYVRGLNSCAETLSSLRDAGGQAESAHTGAVKSLKIRLSNILWRAHLNPAILSNNSMGLDLAQKSADCLDSLDAEELSKAAFGPRLERLASLYEVSGSNREARVVLLRAIKHYNATDGLADAVEASLSKQSGKVWTDKDTLAFQLGRVLDAHCRLCTVGTSDEAPTAIPYDDESLADSHRAVLLEHQLMYMLKKHTAAISFRHLLDLAQVIANLACQPQHQIWRLRFICNFVFRAAKQYTLNDGDTAALDTLLSSVPCPTETADNVFLAPFKSALMSLACLQRSLLTLNWNVSDIGEGLTKMRAAIEAQSSMDGLTGVLDNCDILLSVLRASADQYMALHQYNISIGCLQSIIHVTKCMSPSNSSDLVEWHTKLAQCHTRCDDLEAAKSSLSIAEALMKSNRGGFLARLRLHLVGADFQLASPDTAALTECAEQLEKAQDVFKRGFTRDAKLDSREHIERDSLVATGAYLASRLAVRLGDLKSANRYARQAAKISTSIWAALEKKHMQSSNPMTEDITMVSLTEGLSKLEIAPESTTGMSAQSWPYFEMHMSNLKHASALLASVGLFDDALLYFKQLQKISSVPTMLKGSSRPSSSLAVLYARAGKNQEALDLVNDKKTITQAENCQVETEDLLFLVEACVLLGDAQSASSLLQMTAAPQPQSATACGDEPALQTSTQTKTLTKARRGVARPKTIKAPARRNKESSEEAMSFQKAAQHAAVKGSHLSFKQLCNEDQRLALFKTLEMSSKSDLTDAPDVDIPALLTSPRFLVREVFALAKAIVSEAWRQLSADSMQSVLTDSAVALPSKYVSRGRNGRVSFLQGGGDKVNISPVQSTTNLPSSQAETLRNVAELLKSGLQLVRVLLKERRDFCSTEVIHALVTMEARISLLLTTMNLPFATSSTELVLKAGQPKDIALQREVFVANAESATQDRASLSAWPEVSMNVIVDAQVISPKLLEDMPSSWSVVSLTLSEDRDELLISKVLSGRSPFLVRIPLRRSNEGEDVEGFVFENAEEEMKSIIENANSSSHDVRGMADKATRAQWHADREILDQRLEMLLQNIESIWLGGFRGVLDPSAFTTKKIKQFGKALEQTLDKHLPSRQRSGNTPDERVEVHEHILEVFLGLGNPEEVDLDDAIIDLLYFVVDILQFNGEQNAYDEIEWDSMLVDVLDGLRACHEMHASGSPRHTILVLDKELEHFPWECLPCLINHPVSRMPSFGSVFGRLEQIRAQGADNEAFTIFKSTAKSALILNPSGDLTSTQSLFEPILSSSLPRYNTTALVNTPPTESQFSTLLTTSDLLLYFGHGSGAQYIRPRTIRSHKQTAVTCLFGCSSAKMTMHGAFESTGMPRSYVLGGSMSVVGCLWDVTDREIDRVALQMMISWGLVDGDRTDVKQGLKVKGRKRRVEVVRGKSKGVANDGRGRKTLVEAVTEGRQACVLRYLCGAAVVVYGVPVVLGE